MNVLEGGSGKEAEIAEQHDSAVAFARKEVAREHRPFRGLAEPAGLLDSESKRLNELSRPNSGVVAQIVFQKSVVHQFFRATFDGFLKLDFKTGTKSLVDLSRPSRLYAA